MPRTVIYARKSTESEDRQILSIDSQVRELRQLAEKLGLHVDKVFTESKSAKTLGRPIFAEMLAAVQRNEIDQLICWKLDRLARNPVDGGALIWALEEGKLARIHSPHRSFENTGDNKFWMQLEFGMAKKYVDDLSDNVRRGLRAKLEMGWYPTLPPLGYLNERNTRTIISDPDRFALVRKMWHLLLTENYSANRILDLATNKWGLRTRRMKREGGKPLALSALYKIFANPFYYGMMRYHGVLYPGQHEPMISKADFDQVQEILNRKLAPRGTRPPFAFTGMIRCGECGNAITAEHKVQKQGHRYVYYHCTRPKGSNCKQKVIEVRELERQINQFLESVTVSKTIVEWAGWLLEELHKDEMETEHVALESLERRLSAATKELGELTNMRLRGLLSDEEFVAKKNELEQERFRLRELMEDNHDRFSQVNDDVLDTFRFAETARERFNTESIAQKRAVLRFTGSNFILLNGKLNIDALKPLLLIKKALEDPTLRKLEIELPGLSQAQRETAIASGPISGLCSVVEALRTFVMQKQLGASRVVINGAYR